MSVPIALLVDDFTNNVVDSPWSLSSNTGSATFAETGGQARLTLPASTAGTHTAFYRTSATYDLSGGSFYWNIQTMVSTAVAATVTFDLYIDTLNALRWRQVSNVVSARTIVAGVDTQQYSATWSATTYKYLRIGASGGNVSFDSSTNGTSWTNRATFGAPFAITSLHVQFTAECGNVATPGSLRLDDVNLILPAPSSTWRETTADWSIKNRLRSVTLASDGGKQGVLVTADTMDETTRALGGTVRYFAGPMGSFSGGYMALTEYASLVLAQGSAFTIPVSGRIDLPAQIDARYMRLYHRSTDAIAHTIYEFVPRRLVQADDIEAESIQAIHIVAHTITADQIAAHTITAVEIGTVNLDATSRVTAGGGVVTLDDTGIAVLASSAWADTNAYRLVDDAGVALGGFGGEDDPGNTYHQLTVRANAITSHASRVRLEANSVSARAATLTAIVNNGSGGIGSIVLNAAASAASATVAITALTTSMTGDLNVGTASGGINVGTATGAGAGQISTSDSVGVGLAAQSNIRLTTRGQDTSTTNYAFYADNSALTTLFYVRNDGYIVLGTSGAVAMGFFGGAGTTKPTVTGSRAGNAALASLLTGLANLGLLTNSSTV